MSSPRSVVTRPHHLVRRFFTSWSSRPPEPDDEAWAADHLLPGERALWGHMHPRDRRHSVEVARCFVDWAPSPTRAEVAGALLHDVGKIECRLGVWGRVLATLVGPRTHRFGLYQAHERIGAVLAQQAGSDPATVDLIDQCGPMFEVLERCDH